MAGRLTFINDSGILVAMQRRSAILFIALAMTCALSFFLSAMFAQAPSSSAPSPATQTEPSPAPRNVLSFVVIDPAHGGTDPGAHGTGGMIESDVVLGLSRLLRISLGAQGLRVIVTRQSNENPSFDDRSKKANAQRGTVFITLHVSSTGPAGTVRVYSMPQDIVPSGIGASNSRLVPWDRAQHSYIDASRKLAALVQTEMAQRFPGSPQVPLEAPVRQLRTVMAPAIAIEMSSVSLSDRAPLDRMTPILAEGVARAVVAFRPIYETDVK